MKKRLLTTLVTILLLTLFACAPRVSLNSNPDDVSRVASTIADFELPGGYAPEFTASLMGYTTTAYNPGDGHSHLYLVQSTDEADSEKLAQMLADMAPGSHDRNTRLTVIENRPVTVRGQAVTLVTSEGVNSDGNQYRQATVAFQGKGGPALLVISEPTERWDQSVVDALIASIE